jgi:ribonuclease III
MDIIKIQQIIEYNFEDTNLLKQSLTHKSYLTIRKNKSPKSEHNNKIKEDNERLEFLGDAVLELVVTDYLFKTFQHNEGYMTNLRSSIVNYKIIGEVGIDLGLDEEILLSNGERAELGKARLTIVADAVEALLGAIYIDAKENGLIESKKFIDKFIISKLSKIISEDKIKDSKTVLQELAQKKFKLIPEYKILATEGKDHNKLFYVGVFLGDKKYKIGKGTSKQEAEMDSAINFLADMSN